MDEIFGELNFRNEIIWKTTGNKVTKKLLSRSHDTIIVYGKSKNTIYNQLYFKYDEEYKRKSNVKICKYNNKEYITSAAHNSQPNNIVRENLRYEWNGHNKQWWILKEKMESLHNDNRLQYNKKGIPRIKRFLDEMNGIPLRDVWDDIPSIQINEKLDYSTQKPIALLERIINIYSNKKDIILDPFAGSGTTGIASINLDRKYILIDKNKKGKKIFESRL